MGEFDRKDIAPKKTGGKQLVMVGVLGATLLGLLVYEFTAKGPQTAAASAIGDGGTPAPLASLSTPDQVLSSLSSDPTEKLLLENHVPDPIGTKVLRNPFRMSSQWRAALTPAPAAVISQPVTNTHGTPRPEPVRVAADGYKLTTIVNGQYAVINNKIVTVGAVVDKARVLDIQADRVVLQSVDWPEGPRTELLLNAPLNK
jgi:hypothetical protein